ncbi:MAG: hypothetical protein EHM43_09775, partial [Ignavibacteriae bacterium]
ALELFEIVGDVISRGYVLSNMATILHKKGDIDASQRALNEALDIAINHKSLTLQATVYGSLGVLYGSIGEYGKALEFMQRGLDVEEQLGDLTSMTASYGNIGVIYYYLGDLVSALDYHQRALDLSIKLDMAWMTAVSTGNIGGAYVGLGDHATGAEYFRRAIPLHEAVGNRGSIARVTGNLGIALRENGELEEAVTHFRTAYQLDRDLGNTDEMFFAAANLIYTLILCGDVDEARTIIDQLDGQSPTDPHSVALYRSALGHMQRVDGDLDAAHQLLTEALDIAKEIGSTEITMSMHKDLRELAKERNDFEGYIAHNTIFLQLTEEIKGRAATSRVANMQAERAMAAEREERARERAVLYSTLPKHIADRVVRGDDVSGDHYDHAAVLFLDIVGFTTHSSEHPPSVITDLLGTIFARFDEICATHGVTKVKTIGDAYLCFKGDGTAEENARGVAETAVAMQNTTFSWPGGHQGGLQVGAAEGLRVGSPVQFRVGVHIGPATAGIIGTERLQYDIWGDTVNMASRMESTGEAGKIHVSEAFASFLAHARNDIPVPHSVRSDIPSVPHVEGERVIPSDSEEPFPIPYSLFPRGEIEVKGKGVITTYWLEGPLT